jgi:ATP-dependent RNA helicase DeaD
MLRIIERATRQPIEPMVLPTVQEVNVRRADKFKKEIAAIIATQDLAAYRNVIEEFVRESGADVVDVAAALASVAKSGRALFVGRQGSAEPKGSEGSEGSAGTQAVYRLEVGRRHGVQPGNIVGALAHEGNLRGSEINGIDIREDHTLVRLPAGIPDQVLTHLRGVKVCGRPLGIGPVASRK